MSATGETRLRFKAAAKPKPSGTGESEWDAIGPRPAFVLRRGLRRSFKAGWYCLTLDMGNEAPRVIQASLSPSLPRDPGGQARPLRLDRGDDGKLSALVLLERATTLRLKLDIDSGASFRLAAVSLMPCARPPAAPVVAGEPEPRRKVLLNIVRLLPEQQEADGADRLVRALLNCLPDRVDLRVAIASHSRHLTSSFPQIEFVCILQESNEYLGHHLDWCDCYIGPLDGLRPVTIGADIAVVGLALDLRHMRMPWFFSQAELEAKDREYAYAINRSNQIVVMSEDERCNLAEAYGIDRITVLHPAGGAKEERPALGDPYRSGGGTIAGGAPYLVYLAAPWPHNNHATLLQAIRVLKRRGHPVSLVLIDRNGHASSRDRLETMAAAYDVADLISLAPATPDDELSRMLAGGVGIVFPTLYGRSAAALVDAMALGLPILATRMSAMPEICADAAFYIDLPQNVLAMADDIERFWHDDEGREAKRRIGLQRSLDFSSSRMADNLLKAIEIAIGSRRALPPRSRVRPVTYLPLSVLVIYSRLHDDDLAWLRSQDDVAGWHRARFGDDADITVALDVDLLADLAVVAAFGRVPKLVLYDARSLDAAVLDFSTRYDQAEAQLVVLFDGDRLHRYNAARVDLALLALGVNQDADYAIFDSTIRDCRTDASLDEVAAVLDYEHRRRAGHAVLDTIIKRRSTADLRNGSSQFLSRFCTSLRRMRVPCA